MESLWPPNPTSRRHGNYRTTCRRITRRRPSDVHKHSLPALMLGAIGVVYGDIGTSPLYAMKESFIGPHPLAVDPLHIFGVLSLIFWSLMLVVTIKYVLVAMRADNKGEGGSFALLALISRNLGEKRWTAGLVDARRARDRAVLRRRDDHPRHLGPVGGRGTDGRQSGLEPLVIPIAIVILIGLFLVQSRGTARVGAMFGPVVLVYFAALAALGVDEYRRSIPRSSGSLSPHLGGANSSFTTRSSPSSRWDRCSSR